MAQKIRFTRYAIQRMTERGVEPREVELTVNRPAVTVRQGIATLYSLGELTVVTLPDDRQPGGLAIRNVLWRVEHRWTSEEMREERKRL